MKLTKITIKNYRSIDELILPIKDGLTNVFVGINESGKSNILKAINLLGSSVNPSKKDCRFSANPDQSIEESFVKFEFQVNKDILEEVYEKFKSQVYCKDLEKPLISVADNQNLTIKEFVRTKNALVYHVDVLNEKKTLQHYQLPKSSNTLEGWGYVEKSEVAPDSKLRNNEDGAEVLVGDIEIVDLKLVESALTPWIKPLTVEKLNQIIGKKIITAVEDKLPDALLWNFDSSNILPSEIDIDSFAKNPNSCMPLKSIFMLAGITNLEEGLIAPKNMGHHNFKAVLKRVSAAATNHLQDVWKDYENVRLEITPNGASMSISIVDDVTDFSFEHRSDGFKRFVSFLLLISAKVKNGEIKHMVLLFDEPEISLHPSGIKNLRDELNRIAQTNNVFIATHSPYMINRSAYEANYVVKKISETTKAYQANEESRLYEDEVLYAALGASIFEVISERNILFEGWQDKKVFDLYLKGQKKGVQDKFKNIGTCFSQGVKFIKNLSPIFQVANRDLLILTDSDGVAIQHKKEHDDARGHGVWVTYSEIFSPLELAIPETIEDFYEKDYFLERATSFMFDAGINLDLSSEEIPEIGRINYIRKLMYRDSVPKGSIDSVLNGIKLDLITNCSGKNICSKYSSVINFIQEKFTI